jgi:antagonist of KipI
MAIEVIRPGLMTSIQDLGRQGWRRFGVVPAGAMDSVALRIANLLVGNPPADAALEVTFMGPVLRFTSDCLLAICGGNFSARVDDTEVPMGRPVWIQGGSQLRFGEPVAGCRAYLAVAGGFDVPEVLGSRSTYLRAGIGGVHGRLLERGDCLHARPPSEWAMRLGNRLAAQSASKSVVATPWLAAIGSIPNDEQVTTVRVTLGRQFDFFSEIELQRFFAAEFVISPASDRMGYRLSGPVIKAQKAVEVISEPMLPGAIQVPPAGEPIVMLADCPVTGGYPKIAQAASVDVSVLAQLRPGAKVHFRLITIPEALDLYRAQEHAIVKLQCALDLL